MSASVGRHRRWLLLLGAGCLVACAKDEPLPPPAPTAAPAPRVVPVTPGAVPAAPAAVAAPVLTAEQLQVPTLSLSAAPADVAKGKQLFVDRGCATCHSALAGVKAIGPDLAGVTGRRPLVYIERMMLRPDLMIRTDPTAKALFAQFNVPMTNQRVDPVKELPFLVDYLKSLEK